MCIININFVWGCSYEEFSTRIFSYKNFQIYISFVVCSAVMVSAQHVSSCVENLLDVGTTSVLHLATLVSMCMRDLNS